MSDKISATLTPKGLSLVVNGKPYILNKAHLSYNKVLTALEDGDYEKIEKLLDINKYDFSRSALG